MFLNTKKMICNSNLLNDNKILTSNTYNIKGFFFFLIFNICDLSTRQFFNAFPSTIYDNDIFISRIFHRRNKSQYRYLKRISQERFG